jgi:flavin-dependent dehydrogenase
MSNDAPNHKNIYDVVITGGGSAGLAAAITAHQRGLKVIVFDAAGAHYDKPCGEGLMPEGVQCLQKLGVALPVSKRLNGISYRLADGSTVDSYFDNQNVALGVRRKLLREALWSRAKSLGVDVVQRPVSSFKVSKDFVDVGGVVARNWIIAEGLRSNSARQLGLIKRVAKDFPRFAVRRHVAVRPWSNLVEVYWHDHCEAYVTPVSDESLNIAFISSKSESFEVLLSHFPMIKSRIEGLKFLTEVSGVGPMYQKSLRRKMDRVFLVGDTAGFIDPMTGEGNSLALMTGITCADLIANNQGFLYPIYWYSIVWRYWFLTSMALWGVRTPARRHFILNRIRKWPVLLQWGLNFLIRSRPQPTSGKQNKA